MRVRVLVRRPAQVLLSTKPCACAQAERYVFFPACAERFGAAVPSLLDQGRDEDADRGMLAAALRVLLEVLHQFALTIPGLPEADGSLQMQ